MIENKGITNKETSNSHERIYIRPETVASKLYSANNLLNMIQKCVFT